MIVIFNPKAGRRKAQAVWAVLDILAGNGIRMDVRQTCFPGHATELAREAVRDGASLVVAAGGDGTIAEVARGLGNRTIKLGIIPLGTANVLAHELHLPFAPPAIAAALAFGRTRAIWPGRLETGGESRLFVQMVGVGFDGFVVHGLPATMKRLLGRAAYVLQALHALRCYSFPPIVVHVDGQETRAYSAIVSKGSLYGGPFRLAPDACPDEPGFSVSLFDDAGAMNAMKMGAALPLGLLPRLAGIRRLRAHEVVLDQVVRAGGCAIPAQADGDPAGAAPLRITDATAPISVVVA